MYSRLFLLPAALAILTATCLPGQTARTKAQAIPRTPDGHPDLQGIWTNATITPLERPDDLAAKPSLTEKEAVEYAKKSLENSSLDRRDGDTAADRSRAYNNLFVDKGTELATVDGMRRTSLIIDPPNGKMPPLTEEGKKRTAQIGSGGGDENSSGGARGDTGLYTKVQDRPLAERCLLGFGSTSGPPMMPVAYNNTYQIATGAGVVMILVEMVHDVRIIHIDGRPHLPSSVRQWLGDSIGHWEGNTLVVETTNFTDKATAAASARDAYRGSGLKVTERFTRIGAGTLLYKATIDDPDTFTRPWTLEYPFLATAGPVFEYACHEGNYAMTDIMGGARREDALGIPNGR